MENFAAGADALDGERARCNGRSGRWNADDMSSQIEDRRGVEFKIR